MSDLYSAALDFIDADGNLTPAMRAMLSETRNQMIAQGHPSGSLSLEDLWDEIVRQGEIPCRRCGHNGFLHLGNGACACGACEAFS